MRVGFMAWLLQGGGTNVSEQVAAELRSNGTGGEKVGERGDLAVVNAVSSRSKRTIEPV